MLVIELYMFYLILIKNCDHYVDYNIIDYVQ